MAISTAMTRPVLLVARVMQWVSSVIVLGLVSYFINKGPKPHGGHLIYEEVIVSKPMAMFSSIIGRMTNNIKGCAIRSLLPACICLALHASHPEQGCSGN
jgi:hypothetical protein